MKCKHGLIKDHCAFCTGLINKPTESSSAKGSGNYGYTAVKTEAPRFVGPLMRVFKGPECIGDMQSYQRTSVRYR